jgi:hypothetical protein
MITPETLLEQCIANYTSAYKLNHSVASTDVDKTALIDSILWVNHVLKNKDLITEDNYKTVLAMIHSKDDENIVVAESIIRNLKFSF